MSTPARDEPTAGAVEIHPQRTLTLLAVGHAVNHAQAVLLPLFFVRIIDEFGVGLEVVSFVAAIGAFSSGLVQATFAYLTRRVSRRSLMGMGGLLFGLGFAAQALAQSFGAFAVTNVASRIGGAPQHPVGNGLLAEQFPPERRGFAISAHISGGNVGTVVVALLGPAILAAVGWRGASILFGIPAAVVGLAIWRWVTETGSDRRDAISAGSVGAAVRRVVADATVRRIYAAAVLGGGGRGLAVANLFVLLYLTEAIGLPGGTTDLMYGVLIVLSVPMPLLAGWLSDRVGRRPTIVGAYVGGALGFLVFGAVGSSLLGLWLGLVVIGLFSFAESPQLQALLADIVPTAVRDVAFAFYFTLAFGVGSLWIAVYGAIIDQLGDVDGLRAVFVLMAATFIAAAVVMWPVRGPARRTAPIQEISV
ncbi:MAG TPA: MFS transporter [Candidatus Deferrimicrobiaceae bacterium]|nr:MFS transporter [Candidatus Deferrimicrobiaceae bacterium]